MFVSGVTLLAVGGLFMAWAERYLNLSTTNHVLSGVGFVIVMVAVVVLLAAMVELLRAPFAQASSDEGAA
jgi:multidrug transporter EmrE-like cation transporter